MIGLAFLAPLGSDAGAAALSRLAGMVRRQAMTMAIADVFLLLTMLFFGIIFLLPLMRRPSAGTGGSGH
jgi:DHA2 family multidrug resistance protein